MESLAINANNWTVDQPISYIFWAFFASLVIRVVLSLLKALKQTYDSEKSLDLTKYRSFAWRTFKGFQATEKKTHSDYWYAYFLGTLEILAYPVLFTIQAWVVIGAWIGVKTVAQWTVWKDDRAVFNLFLIGNLLVIGASVLFLSPYVTVPTSAGIEICADVAAQCACGDQSAVEKIRAE